MQSRSATGLGRASHAEEPYTMRPNVNLMKATLTGALGGLLFGAVHDYIALHIAMREGGQSIAVTAREIARTSPARTCSAQLSVVIGIRRNS